jgi:PKD repeat protein
MKCISFLAALMALCSMSIAQTTIPCNLNAVITGTNSPWTTANPIGGTAPFSYQWSYGRSTQIISTLPPGMKACVTVTDATGCSAVACDTAGCNMRATIVRSNPPYFNFGSARIVGGTAPFTYEWGNGATTALTSVLSGCSSLIVRDAEGCVALGYDSLCTTPSCPTPSFSYFVTPGTNTVNFYNTSGIGGICSWGLGDGTGAIDRHPRVTYSAAGTYDVTLTRTTTINGVTCTKSITQQITVGAAIVPCQASFAIVRDSIGFGRIINTSTGIAAQNALWSWGFTNGSSPCVTTSTTSTSVTFNCPGRYVLCLTAYTGNTFSGCSSSFCDTINIDSNGNVWKSGVLYRLNLVSPYFYTGTLSNENATIATSSAIIHPNPANDLVTIKGIESAYTTRIYNNVGMLVQTLESKELSDNTLSLQTFSRGLYFLQIETASGEKQMHKLMINK